MTETPQDTQDAGTTDEPQEGMVELYDHTLGRALGVVPADKARAFKKITPESHKVTSRKVT